MVLFLIRYNLKVLICFYMKVSYTLICSLKITYKVKIFTIKITYKVKFFIFLFVIFISDCWFHSLPLLYVLMKITWIKIYKTSCKCYCCCCCCWIAKTHQTFLPPRGVYPTRLLCPWDFSGKNTGAGCHFLLQGFFPTQGSNLGLLHWQVDCLPLNYLRAPCKH